MASNYGFTLSVDDLTAAKLKQAANNMRGYTNTVQSESDKIKGYFEDLGHSAQSMVRSLGLALGAHELYNFGKELLNITAEFQGYNNIIKYSSIGAVDYTKNVTYLQDAIDRLKLPMKEATQGFAEMQAGFYGTGIEGEKLRKVFEGVSTASSVLHLNQDQYGRTIYALKEVGELGTLQSRQLRMLAFSLPGAGNLAAQSLGISSAQLHEKMKKGEVDSSDFLPKFAETLTEHFSKGLKNAGESLISQMNVLGNTFIKLQLDMGKNLTPFFTHVIDTLISGLDMVRDIWDSLNESSAFVETLKFLFDWAVKLIPIWAGYKLVMLGVNGVIGLSAVVETLFTRQIVANTAAVAVNGAAMGVARIEVAGFGASLVATAVETEAATTAFVALETALVSFGIGAAIVGFGLLVEKLIEINKEAKDAADSITRITKVEGVGKANDEMFTDLKNRYKDYGATGSVEDKSALLKDLQDAVKFQQDNLTKDIQPALHAAKDAASAATKVIGHKFQMADALGVGGVNDVPIYAESDPVKRNQIKENVSKEEKIKDATAKNIQSFAMMAKKLSDEGIKPADGSTGTTGHGGTGLGESAYNTSNLAGANGGLGQAKIINIHINGPVQQNNGVKESKSHSDEAVQKILEALGHYSDSQNSM